MDVDVSVIIPAAGKSERCSINGGKQYFNVLDKPLLFYCTESFLKVPHVRKVILVVDNIQFGENLVEQYFSRSREKISVTLGGTSRHLSIKNGLNFLSKTDCTNQVILVHDGARPLVCEQSLQDLVKAVVSNGAAGLTRPLTSTVVKPDDNNLLRECLIRKNYVASETPQGFLYHILHDAYQKCSQEDLDNGTECLDIVLKYCGVKAKLIPGPESLWKVTYKKDVHAAVGILRENSLQVCIISKENNEVINTLQNNLKIKVSRVDSVVGHDKNLTQNDKILFNTIVCFHVREIDEQNQLLDFATVLDIDRQGLIIHVVEHSSCDGMQSTSVYELHRSGRNLARHYEKLKKGVVMIHCLSQNEDSRLVDLITTLILNNAQTFSGQTLFL